MMQLHRHMPNSVLCAAGRASASQTDQFIPDTGTASGTQSSCPTIGQVRSGPFALPNCRWLLVLCGFWLAFPTSLTAAGKIFPIQEFEEVRDRWIGLETTVEGRRTVYDPALIKLKNSTIYFKPQGALPKLLNRSSNLRLTGTLEKVDGKLVFRVTSVAEGPNDQEQYAARERDIKRTVPSEWYALADWVESRGNFYQDSVLLEKAGDCRRRGFDIERQQLPEKDHQARMQLAGRAAELGIPDTVRQELVHEAYILRRNAILANPEVVAEEQLMTDMVQDLPGCKTPLPADDPALRQRYLVNPESVYAATKPGDRPVLHRMLWSSLALTRLERQLAADYQNGFEIASKIDEEVPEFHARAETYREKMLQVRASNVENMTRAEVLELRQSYIDRKQPKLGDEAVEGWLQWRKKRLKAEDVEGILNLADQYEELLKQPETKLRLLMEAATQHPESGEVAERLKKLGYRYHGDKWITEEQFAAIPAGRLELALQAGRVEVGMTSAQVQKSLGVPFSMTRIGAAGIINEIWTYPSPGSKQPIMVYLIRRLPATESTVVGIDALP